MNKLFFRFQTRHIIKPTAKPPSGLWAISIQCFRTRPVYNVEKIILKNKPGNIL